MAATARGIMIVTDLYFVFNALSPAQPTQWLGAPRGGPSQSQLVLQLAVGWLESALKSGPGAQGPHFPSPCSRLGRACGAPNTASQTAAQRQPTAFCGCGARRQPRSPGQRWWCQSESCQGDSGRATRPSGSESLAVAVYCWYEN